MNGLTLEIEVGAEGGWKTEHLLAENPEENAISVLKKRTLACSQTLMKKAPGREWAWSRKHLGHRPVFPRDLYG